MLSRLISSHFQYTNFSLLQIKVFIETVLHSISLLNTVIYFLKFKCLLHIYSGLCSHLHFSVTFNVYDQHDFFLIFLQFSIFYKIYAAFFSGNLILPGKSKLEDCRATGTPDMRISVKQDY